MAATERRTENLWTSSEQSSRVEIIGHDLSITEPMITDRDQSEYGAPQNQHNDNASESNLGIGEQAFSAAGAAFLSAIIVNPLDVFKTRLQVQAAGVPYSHPLSNLIGRMAYFGPNTMFADLRCSPSCTRAGVHGTVAICPPDCFQYKGTSDVFNKIIRQEIFCRRDFPGCGEGLMQVWLWLYQRWESIYLAMTYSETGWRGSQHNICLVQHHMSLWLLALWQGH